MSEQETSLQVNRILGVRRELSRALRALQKANELYKAIEDAEESSENATLTSGQARLLASSIDTACKIEDYATTMVRRLR